MSHTPTPPAGGEKITIQGGKLHVPNHPIVPFIEGDGIFLHPVDVVVCDGFVGNVALKAGEGVAKLITHFRSRGTRRMVGDVLKENERMLELARQLGLEVDPSAQDPDTTRVVLALEAPSSTS